MRWSLVIPVLTCLIPIAAFGSPTTQSQSSDAHIFLEAVALSRNGQHAEARERFAEYREHHPDGLLSNLRIFYDRFFDAKASNLGRAGYEQLLHDVDHAITIFETKGCEGTDIHGLTGDTVDCEYVGAALYSFREVVRIKMDGPLANREVNGADDKNFFLHARNSQSLQVKFLLGIHEYEASGAKWHHIPAAWVLKAHGMPVDRDEALQLIQSAVDDKSPFVDDVWFYLLRLELTKKDGFQSVMKNYPPATIIARLQPKYPNNRIFKTDIIDYSDSYEDH